MEKTQKEGRDLLFFVTDAEIIEAVFAKWDGFFFQSRSEVRENGEKVGKPSLLWDEPQVPTFGGVEKGYLQSGFPYAII